MSDSHKPDLFNSTIEIKKSGRIINYSTCSLSTKVNEKNFDAMMEV